MPLWLFIGALFISGFILLLIEVLVIPGFGAAGILSIIAIALACYQAFTGLSPLIGIIVTIGSIILTFAMFKILPRTAAWNKILLSLREEKKNGFQVARPEWEQLLNRSGTTLTMLRPSGIALINEQRCDVVTDGEFIEKNTRILVYKIEGNKIIVRRETNDTQQ
jgi:membrane-bound serine protease (ClpP class)